MLLKLQANDKLLLCQHNIHRGSNCKRRRLNYFLTKIVHEMIHSSINYLDHRFINSTISNNVRLLTYIRNVFCISKRN